MTKPVALCVDLPSLWILLPLATLVAPQEKLVKKLGFPIKTQIASRLAREVDQAGQSADGIPAFSLLIGIVAPRRLRRTGVSGSRRRWLTTSHRGQPKPLSNARTVRHRVRLRCEAEYHRAGEGGRRRSRCFRPQILSEAQIEEAVKWHERQRHLGYRDLKQLAIDGVIHGLPDFMSKMEVDDIPVCEHCTKVLGMKDR